MGAEDRQDTTALLNFKLHIPNTKGIPMAKFQNFDNCNLKFIWSSNFGFWTLP